MLDKEKLKNLLEVLRSFMKASAMSQSEEFFLQKPELMSGTSESMLSASLEMNQTRNSGQNGSGATESPVSSAGDATEESKEKASASADEAMV